MSNRIVFESIWAKNFRSIDNTGMELIYQSGKNCIGSLDNGAGKSTLLIYALYYALYDKTYGKGSTKTSLINSRSNKDCVVEVRFKANGSSWRVRRGQKPTLFEIEKDGELIKDEAALKDYAANLDKVIGMDEKAFCNTIALGKDKFVPFVSMSAPDRRNYGEQMLDLMVISKMNDLNKEQSKALNVEILQLQTKLNNTESEIRNVNVIIDVKKQHAAQAALDIDGDIQKVNEELTELIPVRTRLTAEVATLLETKTKDADRLIERNRVATMCDTARLKIESLKVQIESNTRSHQSNIQRLEDILALNHLDVNCPHCKQRMPEESIIDARKRIDDELTKAKIDLQTTNMSYENALKALSDGLLKADTKLSEYPNDLQNKLESSNDLWMKASGELQVCESSMRQLAARLRELQAKKEAAQKDNTWDVELQKIEALTAELTTGNETMSQYQKRQKAHEINAVMLKDDGVKSQMVNQYLPFINDRINHRLNKMNLFINIELDTEFEIKMNAPDRRGQNINSLSSGQQCRIDLAVLLAWRDVAKAAASCDSNLLILDEVLESLSASGVEDFVEMWSQEDQSDVGLYVITQRLQEFAQHFDRCVVYKLVDESTRLSELPD